MKRLFLFLSFLICISFVMSASTFVPHLFWVKGTAYPFPFNYSESDLEIKGKVNEVKSTRYISRLKFGKPAKDVKDREELYKFENGRLLYYELKVYKELFGQRVFETYKFSFVYSDNNITEVNLYNEGSNVKFKYIYDINNNLIEVKQYNFTWIINYASKNQFTICEYYSEKGLLEDEYVYKNGLLAKNSHYSTWPEIELFSITNYFYNAQRKLIKQTYQSKRGNNVTNFTYNQKGWNNNFTYATDAKGNWIEKKEKTNNAGDEFYFTERTITYEQ